jgi:Icc-related predicted phosphoesterase
MRLFYASDVHGSDLCWRKFINSGKHFEADTLIMGGDLTGKSLIPIVRENGHFVAHVIGERRVAQPGDELDAMIKAIQRNGQYPLRMESDEFEQMRSDEALIEAAFERAMLDSLRAWIELADERLRGTGIQAYIMPGNDDPWSVDEVIAGGEEITACDGRVIRVGDYELLSLGWANETPWDSPRELSEDDLYNRIRSLCDQLEDPSRAILNLHVPPRGHGLDMAIEIDDDFRPVLHAGETQEIPVGSAAVLTIIEEVQPLLTLHGHIHESKGAATIGRTLAINPGSDYTSGRLDGCVVDLADDQVLMHRLISG